MSEVRSLGDDRGTRSDLDPAAPIAPRASEPDVPRVILMTFNMASELRGETLLPRHYYRILLKRGVDVWLVAPERARAGLETAFPNQFDRIVIYREGRLEYWLWRLLHRPLPLVTKWMIGRLDQIRARPHLDRLTQEVGRCVVHQINPVSQHIPTVDYGPGHALIIGPMQSGILAPRAFRRLNHVMDRMFHGLGRAFLSVAGRWTDGRRRAVWMMYADHRCAETMPHYLRSIPHEYVSENGVDFNVFGPRPDADRSGAAESSSAPRFVFVGALVDWKCADLALKALHQMPTGSGATLEVIGDGPLRAELEALARSLGLADRVRFQGWRTQEEMRDFLGGATALLLPSMRETGGAVVLEAMAMRIPVVATNWGGPATYLDASCGILVEPETVDGFIQGFAQAMQYFVDHPEIARRMGEAGRRRALEGYDWEKKLDHMIQIYKRVSTPHVA